MWRAATQAVQAATREQPRSILGTHLKDTAADKHRKVCKCSRALAAVPGLQERGGSTTTLPRPAPPGMPATNLPLRPTM